MAIRSTVADSVLGAIGSIGQQALNTQQYIAAQQTIQDNARKMSRQEEKDLVSEIDMAGNYRVRDPLNADSPINNYDFYKLAQERPDLAIKVLNKDPKFNIATDERGRQFQTQVSGFDIDEATGNVVVKVTRPDGREVPLTQNRTSLNDDVVLVTGKDDFNRLGSNAIMSMYAKGAGENTGTATRDFLEFTEIDQIYRAEEAHAIQDAIPAGQGAFTTETGIMSTSDDSEVRDQLMDDLEVDKDQVDKNAVNEIADRTGLSPDEVKQELSRLNYDDYKRLSKDRQKQRGRMSATDRDTKKLQRLRDEVEVLKRRQDTAQRANQGSSGNVFDSAARDELSRKKNARQTSIERKEAQIKELEQKLNASSQTTAQQTTAQQTAAQQNQSDIDKKAGVSDTLAGVDSDQSGQDALKKVHTNKISITQQDVDIVGDVLKAYGVDAKEKLVRLPSKDLMKAAFVMASRHNGTLSEKLGIYQELVNIGTTGDKGTSIYARRASDIASDQNQLRKAELVKDVVNQRVTSLETIRSLNEAEQTKIEEATEDVTTLLTDLRTVAYDNEGQIIDDPDEVDIRKQKNITNELFKKARNFAGGAKTVYEAAAMEALMNTLLTVNALDDSSIFEFSDTIDSIFNADGQLRVGMNDLADQLRAEVSNGEITGYFFINPETGRKYNFPMSVSDITANFDPSVKAVIDKLALRNNEKNKG